MGRFLNADAFASTGQGILGNNMFAYCNNDPIYHADPTGLMHIVHNLLLDDKNIDNSGTSDQSEDFTIMSKLVATVKALMSNFELSAGVGQGLYAEFDILDVIGIGVGVYGNYGCISYIDGKLSCGQEIYAGHPEQLLLGWKSEELHTVICRTVRRLVDTRGSV